MMSVAAGTGTSVKVRVSDLSGRVVAVRDVPLLGGTGRLQLLAASWAAGTYIVTVVDEHGAQAVMRVLKR